MLNLTLFAFNKKNNAQYLTKDIKVSSMYEFEIGYQKMLPTIPYEKFYLDVVANNDTLSDEQLELYNKIVDLFC